MELSGERAELAAERERLGGATAECQSLTEQLAQVRQGSGSRGPAVHMLKAAKPWVYAI